MTKAKASPVRSKTLQKSADSLKAKRTSNGTDIKALLEAGAHFGHQASRWHPGMAPYIHSKREGSHIIDLTKTVTKLDQALDFLSQTAAGGKQILLVSTKRQAKAKIKEVAEATSMPYVAERWLGGMLTNQPTIGGRIKYLKDLESRLASGELAAKYSKLEVQRFAEEIEQMNHIYGGIKDMAAKPGAVFVVDVPHNIHAVREARKLDIPVVALIDSNVDPSLADFPIPCNDDATKTIDLVLGYVQQAIEGGKSKRQPEADTSEPTATGKKSTIKKMAEEPVEEVKPVKI
ncbi:30S ribosomal protein S2 [Candidatus Saccharibacteria bacterium]|nr:30S ribosomal protein S2 [Candidatus Saccharibacteria bacterium]